MTIIFAKHGEKVDADHLREVLAQPDCEELVDDARKYKKVMGGRSAID